MLVKVIAALVIFILGFFSGIYALPIMIAPDSPSKLTLQNHARQALFKGTFNKDLAGSDAFHYGEGVIHLSNHAISHEGTLSPGPDYQLYLSNRFIDNEKDFLAYKGTMTRIASVRSFNGFKVTIPQGINIADFNTVIIWCESFEEFITAAKYQ